MKLKTFAMASLVAGWGAAAAAQSLVAHTNLQAVTATGTTAFAGSHPFLLRGVILNDPAEILDTAYNPNAVATTNIGGQYQVFIQAAEAGDRGGTALWMGQNYQARGMLGEYYEEADWSNELARLLIATNGRAYRKGDLIEVTAQQSLPFGGKRNVNEGHLTDPANDFDLRLVKANAGLPQAEAVALSNLVTSGTNQIFDPARATGGEHWQGMRVRLDGIRLTDTNGWGKTNWSQRLCLATDGAGRNFPLRMPLADLGAPPATSEFFSATGILNQESGAQTATNGYELFVQEIGPVLRLDHRAAGGVAVSFSSDYEGYVLEASDDGLQTWGAVDLTPRKMIVLEDSGAPTNRMYRLKQVE